MTRPRPAPPETGLPVEAALPAVLAALDQTGRAVLTAPPGAGKTTLAPLHLLAAPWATGRIVMLEPRRLAARGAAHRMAEMLGEGVGETVGYRIRGETRTSAQTRIEVVTEGVLTRMIQSDPELSGVSAILFDEFHERSLHADLGLALAIECAEALRPDLRLLVMSATLDAEPVAALIGAPVVASEGRLHPIETHWLDAPWRAGPGRGRLESAVAALAERALAEGAGDVLVFLPGAGEIARTRAALNPGKGVEIAELHGAMPFKTQRAALAAAPPGRRKIVLSTAIAETSLTVEGVRAVVDAGLARRSRFDPGAGMSRLVTEKASRAEADQRRGRAGRLAPGRCYRLWTKGEEAGRPLFAPPEIEIADLAPLALELAAWGAEAGLAFLTPPPEGPLAAARALLHRLGALDAGGAITAHGRALAQAPTHPRLAHMILSAPAAARRAACDLAALIEDRDPLPGAGADIAPRLAALRAKGGAPALSRIREEAARLAKRMRAPGGGPADPGPLIARAFPDRVALRRPGGPPRFLLAQGAGAELREEDALAAQPLLAVAALDGAGRNARIRLAAPLTPGDLETLFADDIAWADHCAWDRAQRRVIARRERRLGALRLEERAWTDPPATRVAAEMLAGLRLLGAEALNWDRPARLLSARAVFARQGGADLPDLSPEGALAAAEAWLAPHLGALRTAEDLKSLPLAQLLRDHLGWEGARRLDQSAPESFTAPTGSVLKIDYGGAQPSVAARLQEFFGLDRHPMVAGRPLLIELLSPAGRPVQVTADLPGFWRSSYADVRKDMRGRYPRHPWPEDPIAAPPTRRVKPRGA